jgi:5-formyltetrahydrofolate cyclo-ligase
MAANEMKRTVRSAMKQRFKAMSTESILAQSAAIAANLFESPAYNRCSAVSVYLAMPREVKTEIILQKLFDDEKRVYVPKVTGPGRLDMIHVRVASIDDIANFPKVDNRHTSALAINTELFYRFVAMNTE